MFRYVIIIVVSDPPTPPTPSGDKIGTTEVSVPFTTKQKLSNGEDVRSVWFSAILMRLCYAKSSINFVGRPFCWLLCFDRDFLWNELCS